MSGQNKTRAASAGFALLFRRQYLLWWIFAMNFLLAALAAIPAAMSISSVLGNSLAGERLVTQFDVSVLAELLMKPAVHGGGTMALFPLIFFAFMLLAEGGVLLSYREDRRFRAEEFFGAGGRYFWRFLRLTVCFVIVLAPLFMIWRAVGSWSGRLASDSPDPLAGFRVEVIGGAVFVLVLLAVRLWFDMAQVRMVAKDERSALRALRWSLRTTARHSGSLYWLFLRISVAAWIEMALLLSIWMGYVPHEHLGLSFLLAQISLLLWLGARLWQRAGETIWYQRRIDTELMAAPAPEPIEPVPSLAIAPQA